MICPRCGSTNVNVQVVTDTQIKKKHHSIIWWLLVGWYWVPFKWLCLTIPALIVKIFAPKRQKLVQKHTSRCVCQDCANVWSVE